MATTSLTTFDAALKEDYTLGLRDSVNNSNVILSEAERERVEIVGREAVWSNWHSRSGSTGARGELESLPTADSQKFADPRESLRFLYHTVKVSGPAIELSRNDKGAFLRALDSEMRGADRDLKNDVARQIFGQFTVQSGTPSQVRTGAVALTAANTSTTTLVLNATRAEMLYFFVGEPVDVIQTSDGSSLASNRTVDAIDKDARTITISGTAISTADGDQVVRQGNYNKEIFGLRGLVDNDTSVTVHNISPSDVPSWVSEVVGTVNDPITEDLLMEAEEIKQTEGDGGNGGFYVGHQSQVRSLANKLSSQKRFLNRDAVTPTAGWKGIEVATDKVFVADRYCPNEDIFLLDREELSWAVGKDFGFDDFDGKVLFKALDGSDAFEARMKAYVQLIAATRNAHVRLKVQAV